MDNLRDRCRTCRFFAHPEHSVSSGYCWQCDKPVSLKDYTKFPAEEGDQEEDPKCEEVTGEESVWRPLAILEVYFRKAVEQ